MLITRVVQRAVAAMSEHRGPMRSHVKRNQAVYAVGLGITELVLLFFGFWFTREALEQASNANKAASRGQLYATENVITEQEMQWGETRLHSLYARPSVDVGDPAVYVRLRLAAFGASDAILRCRNVKELYEVAYGMQSFGERRPGEDTVELRRAYTHLTLILTQMHAAYDYRGDGVISTEELTTWLGYTEDIGPHPMLLTTIWTWHEARYMSRGFAKLLRDGLTATEQAKSVVRFFYPEMLTDVFLSRLPDY